MQNLASRVVAPLTRLGDSLRQPATQTDLVQIAKAVVAATVAWWVAARTLSLPSPFLAPWSALLTVQATVYRTVSGGAQSVAATGLGIVLSFVVALAVGRNVVTLALTLLVALLLARLGVLRREGTTVATTALFVLTLGIAHQEPLLLSRLLDTALGVACGVVVNLVLFPPLTHRSAEQQLDAIDRKMGTLMRDMAAQLGSAWSAEESAEWIERTHGMDEDLAHARQLVTHARESSWWNPRRRWSRQAGDAEAYESILHRVEDGIAYLRSIARTVDETTRSAQQWDPRFRQLWVDLLAETGARIADPDASVYPMRDRVDALTRQLSTRDLPGLHWPVYGSLIANLVNIIDVVDDVASARPARP